MAIFVQEEMTPSREDEKKGVSTSHQSLGCIYRHIQIHTDKYLHTCGSDSKEFACNAGNLGLIFGSGRSPGKANSYPLQYSCLENSMDRGA